MSQLFMNNATSALNGGINGTTTSIQLTGGTGVLFPAPGGGDTFRLTLIGLDGEGNESSWEIVECTARTGDVLTVVRGQESTANVAWLSGTRAELRVTAGVLTDELAGKVDDAQVLTNVPAGAVFTDTPYTHSTNVTTNINTSGATIVDSITTSAEGHITGMATRVLTLADLGYTGTTNANTYVLPVDHRVGTTASNVYAGNSGTYTLYQTTGYHRFYINGVEDMRLTAGGGLDVDGNVTAYSTVTASDASLKRGVSTFANALETVRQLRGVRFTWNEKSSREGVEDIGVIAQEVQKVLPELVAEAATLNGEIGETHLAVDYAKMVGVLIEAIKEQQVQIDALQTPWYKRVWGKK